MSERRKITEEELEEIAEEVADNPNTVYICFEDDEYYAFASMPNCVGEHILFKIDPIYFQGSDTLPVIEIREFHCLCGLNKIYPGFLMIPLNLATSTG